MPAMPFRAPLLAVAVLVCTALTEATFLLAHIHVMQKVTLDALLL